MIEAALDPPASHYQMNIAANVVPLIPFVCGAFGFYLCVRRLRRAREVSFRQRLFYSLAMAISLAFVCFAWLSTRLEFVVGR